MATPPSRHLVEDQQGTDAMGFAADGGEIAWIRVYIPAWFHDDACQFITVFGDDVVERFAIVVGEGRRSPAEFPRDAKRIEVWHQMPAECVVVSKIGGELPVMPAVVPADGDL